MRLILSHAHALCNSNPPALAHGAPPIFHLQQIVPEATEPILRVLSRDWHQQVLAMVRERLPKVLIILFFIFLLERIVRLFVKRMQRVAAARTNLTRRAQLRTMATMLRATSYSILGFMAMLQILKLLNINYAPLLASAGILGVGIGLGAQSLFKDIINGVFILIEDQYNVGEVIKVASLTGTVEDLTLRSTRLRDGDGTLYIIPNSQIATVANLSRDFAVATLPVSVDASANPDMVLATLRDIALELHQQPAFADVLLEQPKVLGVDRIEGRTIIYPINLRVRPNQKDAVLRELRRMIVLEFERRGIPLGSDASMLIMQQAKDPTATPAPQPIIGN